MAFDYEGMNARLQELSTQNKNVLTPAAPPDARMVETKVGGGTATVTPYEQEQLQRAMGGQSFRLGGRFNAPTPKGSTSFKLTDKDGIQTLERNVSGGGRLGGSQTVGSYELGSASAQEKDQMMQQLAASGVPNAEALFRKYQNNPEKLAQLMAGVQDYETAKGSFEQQARNYAEGTNILAEGMTEANQSLEQTAAMLREQAEEGLSPMWDRAIAKADEYVVNAQERTRTEMARLDNLITDVRDNMEFGKAHDMQVAVQASLGQMNSYGDTIKRQYGIDSAEYAQFQQTKGVTLAQTQSSIHATYTKMGNQIDQLAIGSTAELGSRMAMYENYNEQAALDVYKAAALADQQYEVEIAGQLIAIEQLKMTNQTALASWIADTPVFSASLSGILALI